MGGGCYMVRTGGLSWSERGSYAGLFRCDVGHGRITRLIEVGTLLSKVSLPFVPDTRSQ
jgi:hypothetical protein